MSDPSITIITSLVTAVLALILWRRARQRLELSLAKHPGLGGHLRWARRFARWLPGYSYGDEQFFAVDGAPAAIAAQRRGALAQLAETLTTRSPRTLAFTRETRPLVSDMQFISRYRVPYQFREVFSSKVQVGSFLQASEGVELIDLDGNRFFDVTGSYGVNVFGQAFYKDCMDRGAAIGRELGAVLGSYHPCVLDNVQRLCAISGKDEVSFHMSGTEAVMQAVRLARYNTGRQKIVRFAGAYHGWWDDVQPGPGNPMPPSSDTLTLRERHPATLRVLERRNDIACVLVNPIQAMHPNRAAPADSTLIDGGRQVAFDREATRQWLVQLREVCTRKGIALIFDEVFLGFRLAAGGAQAWFGVEADLVTYGKTLAGGLPIGVVCGKARFMKRYRDGLPGDVCFARGTFNAHPYVMGSMNAFLHRLDDADIRQLYAEADATWEGRLAQLNAQLSGAKMPVRVVGMATVWSVLFDTPSRYNWLFQFYLREQGIALSWVGSGRMIFSLGFGDTEFATFCERFTEAARQMQAGGWWWTAAGQNNKSVQRQVLREIVRARLGLGQEARA
jgi:glutamate-1-semialdehyde 2,1-aminomutase